MMKGTRHAPGRTPKKTAARKPKKLKPVPMPANPVLAWDIEFRRHPTTRELDLRLVVDKVLKPHSLRIETFDITMPDGSSRVCEFYNVTASGDGRFVARTFGGGLSVGSAFIIRNVPRRPAAWKNTVLQYINGCCVAKEQSAYRESQVPSLQALTDRVQRLEKDVSLLRRLTIRIERLEKEVPLLKRRLNRGTN